MIKINLVREGRAAVRGATAATATSSGGSSNYNGVLLVALIVLGLLLGAGYWFMKNQELTKLQDEVAVRRDEAQKLESIIKEVESFQKRKDSLEKRIALINDLKRNQKNPVKLMDRVSQDLPDLVWLDALTLDGLKIKITGRALNPNAVSNFIANLKADPLFEEPSFDLLTQSTGPAGVNVYSYEMTVNIKAPPPAPADAKTGEGGASGTSTGA